MEVAERLRAGVRAAGIEPSVTISVGVASFPQHADDADDLVRVADEALYASKRAGRNRVTGAGTSSTERAA
jgi:diguanylate cyclase (GGDEF)-like protein